MMNDFPTEHPKDSESTVSNHHVKCQYCRRNFLLGRLTPKVYLAGKIRKNDWRHSLVPNLRESSWYDAPVDCGAYLYVGPFFSGCDHGCYHGPTTHGNLSGSDQCQSHSMNREKVRHRCLQGVDKCDVFLAYIDSKDCYGTIAETQTAIIKGKFIVMAFAPGIDSPTTNDFWFLSIKAHRVHFDVSESDLPELLRRIVVGQYVK